MRNATIANSTPKRKQGSVIPRPNKIEFKSTGTYLGLSSKFKVESEPTIGECSIVKLATERYMKSFLYDDKPPEPKDLDPNSGNLKYNGVIKSLKITSLSGFKFVCEEWPHSQMNENYTLDVDKASKAVILQATTSWGILRGLETFSQLLFEFGDRHNIHEVFVEDYPRFKHRGLMLDTARHYIPLQTIRDLLDVMAMNKLNVFHWHIVDDQSFPFATKVLPDLCRESSFRPLYTYTIYDVELIIRYAKIRGIRVIPEFDTPGHTYSFRHVPNLLTTCYDVKTKKPNGDFGPLDPTKNNTYETMRILLKEVSSLFVDKNFHAGGDEVEFDCWQSNPDVTNWMKTHDIQDNYEELSNYYIRRLHETVVNDYNKTMMVWQEVFDMGAKLSQENTIIQVWKDIDNPSKYMKKMAEVVNAGYQAVLSSCWYLNYIGYGPDWVKYFKCDPAESSYIPKDKQNLVLGGEICMWTEYVDATNLMTRLWPRSSAAAERLWTEPVQLDINEFLHRLEQHRCRLIYRGYQAEPVNGPGYC